MDDLLMRFTVDPAALHAKPCNCGLRYPLDLSLDILSAGMTPKAVLVDYPDPECDGIRAVLACAPSPVARDHAGVN